MTPIPDLSPEEFAARTGDVMSRLKEHSESWLGTPSSFDNLDSIAIITRLLAEAVQCEATIGKLHGELEKMIPALDSLMGLLGSADEDSIEVIQAIDLQYDAAAALATEKEPQG